MMLKVFSQENDVAWTVLYADRFNDSQTITHQTRIGYMALLHLTGRCPTFWFLGQEAIDVEQGI